jgi:ribosomal protein L40E
MNEMQKKNGIIETEKTRTIFEDRKCLRCGEKNSYDTEYCFKCNLKLNMTKEEIMQGITTKDKEILELKEMIKKHEERLEFIYNQMILKVS